jgi:hypothetical protein
MGGACPPRAQGKQIPAGRSKLCAYQGQSYRAAWYTAR